MPFVSTEIKIACLHYCMKANLMAIQTCIGQYFKFKTQSNLRRNDAMGYEMFAIATATLLVRAAASPDWIGQNFQRLREKTLLEITLPGSHNSGNYQGGLHTDVLLGFIFILGEARYIKHVTALEQEASNNKKYHINC